VVVDLGENHVNALFRDRFRYDIEGSTYAYYLRTSAMPGGFSIYQQMLNWTNADNVLNSDFELYSTSDDLAIYTNKWQYCDYNEAKGDTPTDCGPTGTPTWSPTRTPTWSNSATQPCFEKECNRGCSGPEPADIEGVGTTARRIPEEECIAICLESEICAHFSYVPRSLEIGDCFFFADGGLWKWYNAGRTCYIKVEDVNEQELRCNHNAMICEPPTASPTVRPTSTPNSSPASGGDCVDSWSAAPNLAFFVCSATALPTRTPTQTPISVPTFTVAGNVVDAESQVGLPARVQLYNGVLTQVGQGSSVRPIAEQVTELTFGSPSAVGPHAMRIEANCNFDNPAANASVQVTNSTFQFENIPEGVYTVS
jgi:hypothetical protein